MISSIKHDLCESSDFDFILFVFSLIVFGICICVFAGLLRHVFKTYDQGQIDALSGNAKYYLKEYKNGERRWIERSKDVVFPEDHLIAEKSQD